MTLFRNWFSRALIHFKPRRQKNAARLIDIVPAWCWEKVPPFLRWKILSSLESGARRSSQKLSATESLQIIFTLRSGFFRGLTGTGGGTGFLGVGGFLRRSRIN